MKTTQLFGILNLTPDSFSDGGQYIDVDTALEHTEKMIADGADFIDVGAEATNPHAHPVTESEEWTRLEPILSKLIVRFPGIISLDSRHPETVEKFLELGGSIVNDVSGFQSKHMIDLAVKHQPLCIINHFPGRSAREVHQQSIDSLDRVIAELLEKRTELIDAGVNPEKIVLDPGIGFGKTMRLNQELLSFPEFVQEIDVMIGHSRKRFLGEKRMEVQPNLAAADVAIDAGVKYLRVHDVAAHKQHLKNRSK